MAAISPEEAELIRQYLAGSLTQKELEMVETRIVEEPEFRNEVELTLALRDGLRELQRRGEIAPLLSPRWKSWMQPRAALAAALAAVALGVASFLFFLRADRSEPELRIETLQFLATRRAPASTDVSWTRTEPPSQLRMRFDVGLDPASRYAVRIERLTGDGAIPVVEATALLSESGEAELILEGIPFEPGEYRLRLTPQPFDADAPVYDYTLRVEAP